MKIVKCENGNIVALLKEVENVDGIKANSVDASFEKHIPQYNIDNQEVEVFVNHVMEDDHYIEWIMIDYGDKQIIKHFKPGEEARIKVSYQKGMKAYSYCNKHSLWVNEEII